MKFPSRIAIHRDPETPDELHLHITENVMVILNAGGAKELGQHLIEQSCQMRGLTGEVTLIEPSA